MSMARNTDLELIHSHACESEYIVGKLITDKVVLQALRSHHEKYNGEGYPDQLAGETIPLAARIIAITDLYDTLLVGEMFGDHRSTPEQVKSKLIEIRGQDLDPNITDKFLELLYKNPVLYQSLEDNDLKLYRMHYLTVGTLELGDLINQDGNILLKQGSKLDHVTLNKIQNDYPGQKIIMPKANERVD